MFQTYVIQNPLLVPTVKVNNPVFMSLGCILDPCFGITRLTMRNRLISKPLSRYPHAGQLGIKFVIVPLKLSGFPFWRQHPIRRRKLIYGLWGRLGIYIGISCPVLLHTVPLYPTKKSVAHFP